MKNKTVLGNYYPSTVKERKNKLKKIKDKLSLYRPEELMGWVFFILMVFTFLLNLKIGTLKVIVAVLIACSVLSYLINIINNMGIIFKTIQSGKTMKELGDYVRFVSNSIYIFIVSSLLFVFLLYFLSRQ